MNLVMVGASNIVHIVDDILKLTNDETYKNIYIIDDNVNLIGSEISGMKVIGGFSDIEYLIKKYSISHALITISENHISVRDDYYNKCKNLNLIFPNIIHPSVVMSPTAKLGSGVIICAGVVINPHTIVEDNVVIFSNSSIEHHNHVCKSSFIAPGVCTAGMVTIEEMAFIGIGVVILPRITIGKQAIVGAGAVITRDVPPCTKVMGVPGRIVDD